MAKNSIYRCNPHNIGSDACSIQGNYSMDSADNNSCSP